MPFYKEQAQQFYEGLVAEVNFATISDLVRRRTNLLIRKQTGGRIKDFVKTNTVPLRSPLAALSANVFQTDCNTTLTSFRRQRWRTVLRGLASREAEETRAGPGYHLAIRRFGRLRAQYRRYCGRPRGKRQAGLDDFPVTGSTRSHRTR